MTTTFSSDELYEGTIVLPAEVIDGDVLLTAVFTGSGVVGIEEVSTGQATTEPSGAYDLQGRKIKLDTQLPKGIYIVNGRKIVKS